MNLIKKIFQPAPFIKRIQDEKVIDKNYRYWRVRIFCSMYLAYAFFYFTRKSFTFAIPTLKTMGYSMADLGWIGTTFAIVYGVSKFLSGLLGDRSNPRYFMAIGLVATGVFNFLIGSSNAVWLFALFWAMNALFQGWGWPACAKLLTHWYSPSERGRWWSTWNTSQNMGAAFIPLLVAFAIDRFGWSYAMYLPGSVAIAYGLILMKLLRDSPQSLGLPSIEEHRNDFPDIKNHEKEKECLTTKEVLVKYVLGNRAIWLLAFAYFFVYIVRTGVEAWSQLFLVETKEYSLVEAASCVCWFEIGGFFGSLAAGWGSDSLFKGLRNPINVLFAGGVAIFLLLMWNLPVHSILLDSIFMFAIGFFIFGPQLLIGVAAAELSHKNAAGTATGFAGCFSYLGAAFAGGPLAHMVQRYGWGFFFTSMIVSATIVALSLLPLWNKKTFSHGAAAFRK